MKGKWLLCEHCIQAIQSRGEKVIKLETIEQEIEFDEKTEQWLRIYDEDEPILKCDWCEEIDSTLYDCM